MRTSRFYLYEIKQEAEPIMNKKRAERWLRLMKIRRKERKRIHACEGYRLHRSHRLIYRVGKKGKDKSIKRVGLNLLFSALDFSLLRPLQLLDVQRSVLHNRPIGRATGREHHAINPMFLFLYSLIVFLYLFKLRI